MQILVINGTYRPEGTTTELARAFMEGVESRGAQAEMVLLRDCAIGLCTNCLKCYAFPGEGVAPCCMQDDMDGLIARIEKADGILFASPVHNGFVTGLMTIFWERLSWRVLRPSEPILECMSMKSRLTHKVRAIASIASAGGMPTRLRKFCDDGTPWLKSNAPLELHGQWIGGLYAGAELERKPQTAQDWKRIYHLRKVSDRQRKDARALGIKMVEAIEDGGLQPVTMETMMPPALRWLMKGLFAIRPAYRVAD